MSEVTDSELQDAAIKAAKLVETLPVDVRGHLAAEIFLELRARESVGARQPTRTAASLQPVAEFRAVTLAEYLAGLGNLSHPVRLTAIAAFRYTSDSLEALTSDDFATAYSEVRVPRPQNLSANLGRCIQRGWLAAAQRDGQHAWRVTTRGQQMLASIEAGDGEGDSDGTP